MTETGPEAGPETGGEAGPAPGSVPESRPVSVPLQGAVSAAGPEEAGPEAAGPEARGGRARKTAPPPKTPPKTAPKTGPKSAPWHRWLPHSFLGFVFLIAGLVAGTFGTLALTGAAIRLPVFVVAEVEARLNRAAGSAMPDAAVSLGGIELGIDPDWIPRLRLEDLRLQRPDGKPILTLPETGITFDLQALFRGELRPRRLRVIGARIDMRRDAEGRFDIALGAGRLGASIDGLPALFDAVDAAFDQPLLSRLQGIEADALALSLRDDRLGRVWQAGDGRLRLENRPHEVRAELGLSLMGTASSSRAALTIVSDKKRTEARITATIDGIAAADLADQAPPLAALRVVDAPIFGRLATTLGPSGVTAMQASLTFGKGALRPTEGARPIAFDRASMEADYDPDRGRVRLTALSVESPALRLSATGQSYLQSADGKTLTGPLGRRLPQGFVTQIHVSQAMVDPAGLFVKPVVFSEGAMDFRLRLDPFSVDIGQIALIEGGHRLVAKGKVAAGAKGWQAGVDLTLDRITTDNLLQLWPVTLVPMTRQWLADNVSQGSLDNVRAALRLNPDQPARMQLGYDFHDTEVRFIRTMPPIARADGYATVEGQTYTMVLSKGQVTPPKGGPIDMAGSVFSVLDITQKPAQAEVRLKTASTLTAALSILDEPPFQFLTKAKRAVDFAQGQAVLDGVLRFPLIPRIMPGDVSFALNGRVSGFSSAAVVPGKLLVAPDLSVSADPKGLRVSGPGTVGELPFDATFWQPFGPEAAGQARVEGTAELSQRTVREFNLGLPPEMLDGQGQAQVTIELPKDAPPRLALISDLNRIALALPGTGWSKPPATRGRLEVEATLGPVPRVDRVAVTAPGLSAEGKVILHSGGALDRAEFPAVSLGGWLKGGVTLTGRGAGRPVAVALTSGSVDLRRMGAAGGGKAGGPDIPISARLDQVVIADDLRLTGFRGEFTPRGGFNGSFSGLVNGIAGVTGSVVQAENGTAVRVRSGNAGAVLDAAGIFASARGGALDMQLVPRASPGTYDGQATIDRVRVANAPVLAELLSAISVVGLLEQLNGEGVLFNRASGEFVLTPGAVQITRASAVGASLGVSMAGVYGTATKTVDLQGVVSPLYLLNGIGSFLTKKGEGVFGFNYAVKGDAARATVSVNPLSILTPGRFRELFRSAPPRLGD